MKKVTSVQDRILWREIVIVSAVLFVQLLGGNVTILTFVALSIWALRSPKHAIQALFLSWFITFLNPSIFIEHEGKEIFRWLVLFAAFSQVSISKVIRKPRMSREMIYLALFFFFVALVSMLKSYAPIVSLLKLIIFAVGVSTVLLAFELMENQKAYWRSWITTFFLWILILGFPLYFSEFGYARNGKGFQGLLNHPQAYAVFLAPMVVWFTGRFLFEKNKSVPIVIGVVLGWFSLFSTLSRTGVLAATMGCGLMGIIVIKKKVVWRNTQAHTSGNHIGIIGLCLLCIFLVLSWAPLSKYMRGFLQKGQEFQSFSDFHYLSGRGAIIERSINNFLDNPLTGIGFGIASDPSMFIVRKDKWLGLPTGAPIEKVFLPTAILEEVGILGTLILLAFIFGVIRPLLNWGNLTALCLFITSLLVNMGEMVFFSFGGMGLYIWLMIGFSRILRERKV